MRTRKVRVRAPLGTKLAHFRHNSRVNVWRGGKTQSTRTRTWRGRVDGRNCLGMRTRGVRVRVDGALFFKNFFYIFAPIQAFQTSKHLPKHHKTLFNLLDS